MSHDEPREKVICCVVLAQTSKDFLPLQIMVFSQYKDANLLGSHCASPDSW